MIKFRYREGVYREGSLSSPGSGRMVSRCGASPRAEGRSLRGEGGKRESE